MSDRTTDREIFLRDPSGLPSLESLFGWHSQYERMLRWHQRLTEDGCLDYLMAFFLNCYALRDWLDKTKTWKQNEIDKKIKDNFAMRLCRDICNRSKHMTLTMTPAVDANFLIVREYRGHVRPVGIIILAGGKRSDLRETTDQCVAFWDSALRERSLISREVLAP